MNDLEMLREIFKDDRLHIGIGTVTQLGLSQDGNNLRVMINLLPENREVVAEMGWNDVLDITFPEVRDLAIVAFVDGHPDECHVLRLKTTSEEPIPKLAQAGHSVKYSRPGKKAYFGSDTKIGIARPDQDPLEPLVLGTVLEAGLLALINAFLNASQVVTTPGGPGFLDPSVRTALNDFKATYLDTASTNIVSQIAFTERGT